MAKKSESKKNITLSYCTDLKSGTKAVQEKILQDLADLGYKKINLTILDIHKDTQSSIYTSDACIIDCRENGLLAGYYAHYAINCGKPVLLLISSHTPEISDFLSEKIYPQGMISIQDTRTVSKPVLSSFVETLVYDQKHRYTFFLEKTLHTFLQDEAGKRNLSLTATLETLVSEALK